jgi:hypothetical protein
MQKLVRKTGGRVLLLVAALTAALLMVAPVAPSPEARAATNNFPPVAVGYTRDLGYTLLDSAGHIYNYGPGSRWLGGNPAGATLPFVDLAYTPDGQGYALLDSVGHVYNYGTSRWLGGNPGGATLPFRAITYTPDGQGYALLDSAGHIYNYGTSRYLGGNPAGATLPFVALAHTAGGQGQGYTLLDSAGHIYNYGPGSRWLGGNPAGATLPFVDLAYTPDGQGYALLDSVGHIYNYGASRYFGGFDYAPLPVSPQYSDIVAVGRQLQAMGYSVTEHPQFGGVAPVHSRNSYHYAGRAIDVNWYPPKAEPDKLDALQGWIKANVRGYKELFWRTEGHDDHLHLAI